MNGTAITKSDGEVKPVNASGMIQSFGFAELGEQVLRADGRNSVSINFPVEGNAVHFQKLKDHAEIDLSTAVPSNSGKGRNLLWFIALVSTLFLARDLWQRSFGPNRVRSVI